MHPTPPSVAQKLGPLDLDTLVLHVHQQMQSLHGHHETHEPPGDLV